MTTKIKHVGDSERRFLDGTGERYLKNGNVRCHGSAKGKLNKIRVQRMNPTLTSEDVWPEAQCENPAVEGAYLCKFHGGESPNIEKKELWEYMPPGLMEKHLALRDTNDLMDRSRELNELTARKAELYEQLGELVLGEESYKMIYEAKTKIASGDVAEAGVILSAILLNPRTEQSIHAEIREIDKLIDKVTGTWFGILKDMKDMATTDQVASMKEEFFSIVKIAIDRNVEDKQLVSAIYNSIFDLMSHKHIDVKALKSGG